MSFPYFHFCVRLYDFYMIIRVMYDHIYVSHIAICILYAHTI